MRRPALLPLALIALAVSPPARAQAYERSAIMLNGHKVRVHWSDGDSFKFLTGDYKGSGTRLKGFNALESYGPVHRWGDWKPEELYGIAHSMATLARAQVWECTTKGEKDGYGRVLVDCPGLAKDFVGKGLAMVFAVNEDADPELLKLQHEAQQKKLGMWEKGVPSRLISSLHSATENGKGHTYNRVVDTKTGAAEENPHLHSYNVCQEVCVGEGSDQSCMVYVPFERRYKPSERPSCLRGAAHEDEP